MEHAGFADRETIVSRKLNRLHTTVGHSRPIGRITIDLCMGRRRTIFDDLRNFRNRPTLTISSAYEEYAYVTLNGRLRARYAIYVPLGIQCTTSGPNIFVVYRKQK